MGLNGKGAFKNRKFRFFNIVNEHSLGINAFIIIELLRNKWISAWIYGKLMFNSAFGKYKELSFKVFKKSIHY